MNAKFQVIAFDADDTLFINEPYFEEAEKQFQSLMSDFLSRQSVSQILFKTQIDNLPIYGYGIKGYILSMIESANKITQGKVSSKVYGRILDIGKELFEKPIVLLDEVEETLKYLDGKYKLIVATKGDLKDQHRKLHLSQLGSFFHHIEVMVEKEQEDYTKMLQRLEIDPGSFLMIGNSLKSDVLPVLEIGGTAVHVPYHTTWEHERIDHEIKHANFYQAKKIGDVMELLKL